MSPDFCAHLDEYGVMYGRAEASYQSCLNLIDSLIENPGNGDLGKTLENGLDEWVLETRNLREQFAKLVKDGSVQLVSASDGQTSSGSDTKIPTCKECSFSVPKLAFPEFVQEKDGSMTYRGNPLPVPQAAEV